MNNEERIEEMLDKTLKDLVRKHTEKELNKVATAVSIALEDIDVTNAIKYMALQLIAKSMRANNLDEKARKICDDIMANSITLAITLQKKEE